MISAARKSDETKEPPEENSSIGETAENAGDDFSPASEMNEPAWSVVTFEGVAVSNLTYTEAREWSEKLDRQKISGLCIVTDEAAARLSK